MPHQPVDRWVGQLEGAQGVSEMVKASGAAASGGTAAGAAA